MNRHARVSPPATYDGDFHQWAVEQGRALRSKNPDSIDWDNVAEEIETLGRSEKREIESRLTVALLHLLKWQFQPEKRKGGWEASIKIQRRRLRKTLAENPSLQHHPEQELDDTYLEARLKTSLETGLEFEAFPEICPYSVEQVLDDNFLPD
jgi:DNA polymerase elongation subunit (family B)